jgi:Zn-dependent protease with chaperone function
MKVHKITSVFFVSMLIVSFSSIPWVYSASKSKTVTKNLVKPDVLTPLIVSTPKDDMQRVLRRLINDNKLNISDAVVEASDIQDTSVVNAYTDGSKVIITSALWNKLKSDDARAFVLGHELGHITNHHMAKGLARRVGLRVAGAVLSTVIQNPVGNYGAQVGTQLLGLKFDRKQEYQADDSGIQFIMNAKYNKNAAIEVFKVLRASGSGQQIEFLVTHPLPDSRIRKLSEKYGLDSMETTVSSSSKN